MHTLDQSHQMSEMFHRSFVVCKEACFSLSPLFGWELAKVKADKKFILSKNIRQPLYFFKKSNFQLPYYFVSNDNICP